MAHKCPECGEVCYCDGELNDLVLDQKYSESCICCLIDYDYYDESHGEAEKPEVAGGMKRLICCLFGCRPYSAEYCWRCGAHNEDEKRILTGKIELLMWWLSDSWRRIKRFVFGEKCFVCGTIFHDAGYGSCCSDKCAEKEVPF